MSSPAATAAAAATATVPLLRVVLVTSNANKLSEIRRMLSAQPALASSDVDLPELQGEPGDVARAKCAEAARRVWGAASTASTPSATTGTGGGGGDHDAMVLVEDTSLCFNALGGLPGVFVKWFLDKTGREGLVKLLSAWDDKTAYAQCIFALAERSEAAGREPVVRTFVGRTNGRIVDPRGPKESFGWDPVFEPDEGQSPDAAQPRKTYAEMTKDEKNAISHRGKALQQVVDFLLERASSASPPNDAKKPRSDA